MGVQVFPQPQGWGGVVTDHLAHNLVSGRFISLQQVYYCIQIYRNLFLFYIIIYAFYRTRVLDSTVNILYT